MAYSETKLIYIIYSTLHMAHWYEMEDDVGELRCLTTRVTLAWSFDFLWNKEKSSQSPALHQSLIHLPNHQNKQHQTQLESQANRSARELIPESELSHLYLASTKANIQVANVWNTSNTRRQEPTSLPCNNKSQIALPLR